MNKNSYTINLTKISQVIFFKLWAYYIYEVRLQLVISIKFQVYLLR